MALPVVYRQSARSEVVATARWYERERVGLAAMFIAEVERIEACVDLRRDPQAIARLVRRR
ncbi:MAG: hypothetical protein ACM3II_10100 [Rhodospirillaceae bacterium]